MSLSTMDELYEALLLLKEDEKAAQRELKNRIKGRGVKAEIMDEEEDEEPASKTWSISKSGVSLHTLGSLRSLIDDRGISSSGSIKSNCFTKSVPKIAFRSFPK